MRIPYGFEEVVAPSGSGVEDGAAQEELREEVGRALEFVASAGLARGLSRTARALAHGPRGACTKAGSGSNLGATNSHSELSASSRASASSRSARLRRVMLRDHHTSCERARGGGCNKYDAR